MLHVILFAVGVCPYYDSVGKELQNGKCFGKNCTRDGAYLSIFVFNCELTLSLSLSLSHTHTHTHTHTRTHWRRG